MYKISFSTRFVSFYMCLLVLFNNSACAQYDDDLCGDSLLGVIADDVIDNYKYIRFAQNKFIFQGESTAFEKFYLKLDTVMNNEKGQLNIYHIGGSHLQADVYTNRFRSDLITLGPGLKTSRGWIFPFGAIGTNNPASFKVKKTGDWDGFGNTKIKDSTSNLGVMGACAFIKESGSLKIFYGKNDVHYLHNLVRVYHTPTTAYNINIAEKANIKSIRYNQDLKCTEIAMVKPYDTLNLLVEKINAESRDTFMLFGIQLLNTKPGIVYNTLGVNGAGFKNWLRCGEFFNQLAISKPDLFIVSVGTNEANVDPDEFKADKFEEIYSKFIDNVLKVNPHCAILLTVPNDAYYLKRHPNKNLPEIQKVIYKLAKKYNAGVWDFYNIMGGQGASQKWYNDNLMQKDRIHFTFEGYTIKGDLIFEAFLKYLDEAEFKRLVKLQKESKKP